MSAIGMCLAPVVERSNLWRRYFHKHVPLLSIASGKLLAIHVTSCAAERNWSKWGWVYQSARRNRLGIEKAQKLVTIQAAHGKKHESGRMRWWFWSTWLSERMRRDEPYLQFSISFGCFLLLSEVR